MPGGAGYWLELDGRVVGMLDRHGRSVAGYGGEGDGRRSMTLAEAFDVARGCAGVTLVHYGPCGRRVVLANAGSMSRRAELRLAGRRARFARIERRMAARVAG